MPRATEALHERIAFAFDFDDTLAPGSFESVLVDLGLEVERFRSERVAPRVAAGWDEMLAGSFGLIEASRESASGPVTRERLARIGAALTLFDGVEQMFDRVRERVRRWSPAIEVEFHLVSCGIAEVARGTTIARQFDHIWGCEFHYDDGGGIETLSRIVTHPEKVRYLLQISKGPIDDGEWDRPVDVYRDLPSQRLHVPLDQIVFVGDGASDMPAFRLMRQHAGIAIGVYSAASADRWPGLREMTDDRHVENLAPADYSEDSELMRSLLLSADSICSRIALRRLGRGE